jgi:hypothetical protein
MTSLFGIFKRISIYSVILAPSEERKGAVVKSAFVFACFMNIDLLPPAAPPVLKPVAEMK